MPRKPRMYLPGVPAHVVQRGNNREPCFFQETDYRVYLATLAEAADRYEVAVHAYVLMTNHVHLLMTPSSEQGISRLMQSLGRGYVRHVNEAYGRSGTLWEGRHKASLVQADDYLLSCYRYIELNPVRAGMVLSPEQYPWSSYGWHAWGRPDAVVSDHPLYVALAPDAPERQGYYRQLFAGHVPEACLLALREAFAAGYPLGNDRFKARIAQVLGRTVGHGRRGRPGNSGGLRERGPDGVKPNPD